MIYLNKVSKRYGDKLLFSEFSFQINDGARIALLGPNGAGKSTLLKIITGEVEPDSGSVEWARFDTTVCLPQDGVWHWGNTLMEETAQAFADILRLEERIAALSHRIEDLTAGGGAPPPELPELLDELGHAQHDMERREGYAKEAKIKEILFGLGFTEEDLPRKTEEFSGGWHMRIELAKLLLREPSVLLLDEPTNHLDMESLEWLEEYLLSYQGSIVLVSHDSRFLDTLVNQVVELSLGKATEYRGNYSSYLLQKSQRRKITEASYENQQKLIERTTRFVERFRYKNTKARQAQSRLKMLEKLNTIELEGSEREIAFSFPDPPRSGRVVLELEDLQKSYGAKPVLSGISLSIESGDRIACLGVNGSGKSTLARIMAGIEAYDGGERRPGHNVAIAYYGQNMTELLHPDRTVLETLDEQAPFRSPGELRTLLGSFLFTGDDVFKPVSVLSGGEKSRLALAKMLLEPANFLILDEPTNHLDARSKAVLQKRLREFPGTFYVVSHDRDFLAPIINKVLALGQGGMEIYGGSVEEYLERIQRLRESAGTDEGSNGKAGGGKEPSADRDRKRREARTRQERHRRIRPLRDEAAAIEKAIQGAEARRQEIEGAFGREETFADERLIQSLQKEYADLSAHLESLYDTWAARHESIEAIEQEFSST